MDWKDSTTGLTYEDFKQRAGDSSSIIDNPQFRQVNAFAVASHTLQAVEDALEREIIWRNGRPLEIRAHVPEIADGYYDSFSSSLYLGCVKSQSNHNEEAWISLSHDIISHEVGHAIWDSFRPLLVYSEEIDTDALHESFADLIALFSKLEHDALVKRLYEDMLRKDGEDAVYSSNFFENSLLRPCPFVPYDPEEPKEAHERSTIWTGAICDILDKLRKTHMPAETETRKGNSDDFKQAVVSAVEQTRQALVRALHYVPLSGVTMPLLARLFYKADERLSPEDSTIRDIAKEVFEKRKLWDSDIRFDRAPSDIGQAVKDYEKAVEDFEKAGERADAAARLTRIVVDRAETLGILPAKRQPRILTPRITKANKEVYLYFAYELVETIDAHVYEQLPGTLHWDAPRKKERVRVPSYYGGIVVMDEKCENGILVTDPPPPAAGADTQEVAPVPQPARLTEDRRQVITGHLGYLLRRMQGYRKTPGFTGFDWPYR